MDGPESVERRARPGQLTLLVAARQPIARAGLAGLLADRDDLAVVGQAATAEDAERQAAELRPSVVLAAWDAGHFDEVLALAEALEVTATPLVLLGEPPAPADLNAYLRRGVRGFLMPDASADQVAAALVAVAQGLAVLDGALGSALAPGRAIQSVEFAPDEPLTEREREVLELLALGLPNKTIAARLRISEHTVKFHVGSIMAKLDAASRTEAVTRAARAGLLAL